MICVLTSIRPYIVFCFTYSRRPRSNGNASVKIPIVPKSRLRGAAVSTCFRMTGAICLSYKELPGGEGNITEEQLRVLLSEGYTTAVIYDGGEPLSEYLEKTRAALSNLSFEMPDLLYVYGVTEGESYYLTDYTEDGEPIFTEELDAVLEGYGIKTVVQETYATKTVSYTNFYEPFKYAESLGFLATKRNKGLAADSLNDALSERGAVVYSVGFDFNDSHSYFGMYDGSLRGDDGTTTDNFVQMLTALAKHTQTLKITGVGGVRAYREEYNLSIPDLETVAKRLAELQAELDSVEAEITAVKAKYYD